VLQHYAEAVSSQLGLDKPLVIAPKNLTWLTSRSNKLANKIMMGQLEGSLEEDFDPAEAYRSQFSSLEHDRAMEYKAVMDDPELSDEWKKALGQMVLIQETVHPGDMQTYIAMGKKIDAHALRDALSHPDQDMQNVKDELFRFGAQVYNALEEHFGSKAWAEIQDNDRFGMFIAVSQTAIDMVPGMRQMITDMSEARSDLEAWCNMEMYNTDNREYGDRVSGVATAAGCMLSSVQEVYDRAASDTVL